MKLLFLRGQVPQDRDPSQIIFDDIDECDDVWSQLAYRICKDDIGEIWYWGGRRKVKYKPNFIERWIPDFKKYKTNFSPNVIFARGGFKQYDVVLRQFPKAYKIYYGAGKRFIPQSSKELFNLILVDTPKQLKKAKLTLPESNIQLFIKPAADNIFYPRQENKKYDVIFSSNQHPRGIKGHDFILPAFPKNLKMIQIGIVSSRIVQRFPNIKFTGWISRKSIPYYYAKSKIAVVCCSSVDSCPRIISEALACNCPVLLLNTVNVWEGKYITPMTGRISTSKFFIKDMISMINDYRSFSAYEYYAKNLSLSVAAKYIKDLIN